MHVDKEPFNPAIGSQCPMLSLEGKRACMCELGDRRKAMGLEVCGRAGRYVE